jgi:hypothetical protein
MIREKKKCSKTAEVSASTFCFHNYDDKIDYKLRNQ